jgi:hypothetical protein
LKSVFAVHGEWFAVVWSQQGKGEKNFMSIGCGLLHSMLGNCVFLTVCNVWLKHSKYSVPFCPLFEWCSLFWMMLLMLVYFVLVCWKLYLDNKSIGLEECVVCELVYLIGTYKIRSFEWDVGVYYNYKDSIQIQRKNWWRYSF